MTTTRKKVVVAVLATGVIAALTGLAATVTRTGTTGQTQHGYVTEGGKNYDVIEQNPAAYPNYVPPCPGGDLNCRHAPLETLVANTGCADTTSGCFKFEGYPIDPVNCSAANHCPNDRLEVRLSDLDEPDGLHYGQWRYEKFSIRFDPSTTIAPPKTPRAIVAQVWQDVPGNPLGPPLNVTATDAQGSVRLDWNFKANNDPAAPQHPFYSSTIAKSDTNFATFCWRMKPSPTGPRGAVFIWQGADCSTNLDLLPVTSAINYSPDDLAGGPCAGDPDAWTAACKAEAHSFFNWGYSSGNDAFRISVGMYRPPVMQSMLFWLDDIKLASTGAALQ